ncbi:Dyp-type peroxidase [Frondihabitans australicus]|uniref:Putative iron-dependent peroxidase n=1 Tax=Frondihabitans australicus TaxID=386892 RepID=A0A495IKS0_9MICO|nr:Dyp-type peroxidase [Frondihabitans australicus]RKR76330.1 putative iron-dependent peroxidase [Frondihabitans australicus]
MSNRADGTRVPIDAQSIDAPLTKAAVFLTLTVKPDLDDADAVRDILDGLDDLIKTIGFRDLAARLTCVVGLGPGLWKRLSPGSAPAELHPFVPIDGTPHRAPSTAGDLLFHIRADRPDFCFELERLILATLGEHVRIEDEVQGFRYFDTRDLLGFVDGTANPVAQELDAAALVGADDPTWAGGSFIVVQKYLHDLTRWNDLTTDEQEAIIGRSKADNIERDSDAEERPSHKTLATITDDDGNEYDILRDNMPFGRPGAGEYGTYFIGYAGHLWVIEKMLQRMFLGETPGQYDRILDFSTAVTGATFFAPSRQQMALLAAGPAAAAMENTAASTDGSSSAPSSAPTLGIGSLKAPTGE